MRITNERPPEWILEAVKKWGVDFDKGNIAFAYGDAVHIGRGSIPPDLAAHEAVHLRQQAGNPDAWWKRYLSDDQFRIDQELEAYRVQYQWVLQNVKNTNKRFEMLRHYANDLSGGMYGKTMPLIVALQEIRKLPTGV